MNNRTGIVILIILLLNVLLTFGFEWHFSKPPLKQEMILSSKSEQIFDIYIPMHQTYYVEIVFARENKSFEYLQDTLGPMIYPDRQGLPLKLNWQLLKNGSVIQSESILSTDSCGWSYTSVYRCFGKLNHSPGTYQFKVKVSEASSELAKFNTTINISYDLKSGDTWQTTYMSLSMLFNITLAPVIGGIVVLIFLVRFIRYITP